MRGCIHVELPELALASTPLALPSPQLPKVFVFLFLAQNELVLA